MTRRMRSIWAWARWMLVSGWEKKGSRMEEREDVEVYLANRSC